MFHFFHKWKTIHKTMGTGLKSSLLFKREAKVDIVFYLQQCEKCPKQRAFIEEFDGHRTYVNVDWAKDKLGL